MRTFCSGIRAMLLPAVVLMMTGCQPSIKHAILDRDARVREYIGRRLESNDFPGIQYVVVNPDSVVFGFSGGWADIARQRKVEPSTTMMIYSMTKTFTAAAVLQLVERGAVSLDDSLGKYAEGIPYGSQVAIRHLLSQTSGIPNPIPLRWVHLVEEHPGFNEAAALRGVIAENAELDFPPGKRYAYSNISYWLLGRVIEKASGMTYGEYVRRNIVDRLRIPPGEMDLVIPAMEEHARGYLYRWSFLNAFKSFVIDSRFVGEYETNWLHINEHYLNGPAFGGIVATGRAVGTFLQDQLRDSSRLFGRKTKALFYEQQRNSLGEPVAMTPGWHIGEVDGTRYFYKEGGGGGFHCEMRVYPALGIGSVVIANDATFDARGFLNTTDREFRR